MTIETRIAGVMEGQRLDNPVNFIVLDEHGNVLRTEPNPEFVYEEPEEIDAECCPWCGQSE